MTTLAPPKPRKLNRPLIRAEESAYVDSQIPWEGSAEERLRVASDIVLAAEVECDESRHLRDAAALSLSLYDGVRALHDVIGVSRAYFHTLRCKALRLSEKERASGWLLNATREQIAERAAACKVREYDPARAVKRVEKLGEQVARAEQRASLARHARDQAIVSLYKDHSWSRGQIAAVAGVDESRISQIVGAQ